MLQAPKRKSENRYHLENHHKICLVILWFFSCVVWTWAQTKRSHPCTVMTDCWLFRWRLSCSLWTEKLFLYGIFLVRHGINHNPRSLYGKDLAFFRNIPFVFHWRKKVAMRATFSFLGELFLDIIQFTLLWLWQSRRILW